MAEAEKRILSASVRWLARVSGLALFILITVFMMGEGIPDLTRQPPSVQTEFFAMGLMLAGFALGWRWEVVGGGVALGGFLIFCVTEWVVNGRLPGGANPLLCIPGILLLASWGLKVWNKNVEKS